MRVSTSRVDGPSTRLVKTGLKIEIFYRANTTECMQHDYPHTLVTRNLFKALTVTLTLTLTDTGGPFGHYCKDAEIYMQHRKTFRPKQLKQTNYQNHGVKHGALIRNGCCQRDGPITCYTNLLNPAVFSRPVSTESENPPVCLF